MPRHGLEKRILEMGRGWGPGEGGFRKGQQCPPPGQILSPLRGLSFVTLLPRAVFYMFWGPFQGGTSVVQTQDLEGPRSASSMPSSGREECAVKD